MSNLKEIFTRHSSADRFWLTVVIVSAVLIMLPMLYFGIPEGYDVAEHLRFAQTFRQTILDGDFLPGWADVDNYGYGSIGIRFYPPVADYFMALLQLLTGSQYWGFALSGMFWMLLGCTGMYAWAREYLTPPRAAIAGVLFAVMPYHLFEIYQYTIFSEYAAAGILPFCFWLLTRVINDGRKRDVVLFAISYSILTLTHIPTAVTGSLSLGVYALFLLDWKEVWAVSKRLLAAASLSVPAVGFHWLKIATENDWLYLNSQGGGSGFYSYSQYLFPIFLSARKENYETYHLWMLEAVVALTLLCIVPCLVFAIRYVKQTRFDGRDRKLVIALSAAALFIVFIVSIPSTFVWANAPVLHKIQFPWRFLSPGSMIACMLFAVVVPIAYREFENRKRLLEYPLIIFFATLMIFNVGVTILMSAPYSKADFEQIHDDSINQMEACRCFWPVWVKEEAFYGEQGKVLVGDRAVEIAAWKREKRIFSVGPGAAVDARVATFWYPYWKADVNGSPVSVERDANGVILIPLPSEAAEVRLYFQEPWFLIAAKYLSLLTWLGLIGAVIVRSLRGALRIGNFR